MVSSRPHMGVKAAWRRQREHLALVVLVGARKGGARG